MIQIRSAEIKDADSIVNILNKVTYHLYKKGINQWDYPWSYEKIEEDINSGHGSLSGTVQWNHLFTTDLCCTYWWKFTTSGRWSSGVYAGSGRRTSHSRSIMCIFYQRNICRA